jgi:hypothetical protein
MRAYLLRSFIGVSRLSHRLIQVLQGIGSRNQFILSTHSPDVITASLDKSVIFISPPRTEPDGQPANQALAVSEDDTTNRALRLLGHSIGIIALGRKIVLIEGEHSSLDKDVYGSITRGRYPSLVLVPSGGKHVIQSFDALQENVLSKSIWGVEFFMLCDRDSAPAGADQVGQVPGGRFRVLGRCHLENYFLDEIVWAEAFEKIEQDGHWLRDPQAIRSRLRDLASDLTSYATALAVTAEVRQSVGNVDIMPKDCHDKSLDELVELLLSRSHEELARITTAVDDSLISSLASTYHQDLVASLEADTEAWKVLIPGKPILRKFASAAGIHLGRLKNLYLAAAGEQAPSPFEEIEAIFSEFAATN